MQCADAYSGCILKMRNLKNILLNLLYGNHTLNKLVLKKYMNFSSSNTNIFIEYIECKDWKGSQRSCGPTYCLVQEPTSSPSLTQCRIERNVFANFFTLYCKNIKSIIDDQAILNLLCNISFLL